MNKYILCLDASLSCTGYAIFNNDGELKDKGLISTKYIELKDAEIHGEKLLCIFNALNKLEHKYNFDLIIVERSFVKFNKATKAIQKTLGIIELLFNKKKIVLISPLSTKSFLCGKKATKGDMIKSINFSCGLDLKDNNKDHNMADAIALGLYYFGKMK